jgi:S1-C subfamily serine protease
VQGIEPKFTDGVISSLTGVKDEPNNFQISVAIQPGNSGGPLISNQGNVVGIVASKLNAEAMLRRGGTSPENVNYAVKSN